MGFEILGGLSLETILSHLDFEKMPYDYGIMPADTNHELTFGKCYACCEFLHFEMHSLNL